MKRILPLAGAAIAALALTIVPAAAATNSPASGAPPLRLHVVSLHSVFERALPTARAGQIAGVVPSRRARLGSTRKSAAPAACTEPNCNLSYFSGPVQHTPHVYLLLWGPNWSTTNQAYKDLSSLYQGLGETGDTWSTVTSQYSDSTGSPTFSGSVFEGVWKDASTPPNPVTEDDLAAEAESLISTANITDLADAQIVVASQSGTCFNDGFAGSCGVPTTSSTGYCGWHSMAADGLPFTNLPYQLDAGYDCGENFVNGGTAGKYDGFTLVGGHEYAETITDPDPITGWDDPSDSVSGGEVADKCVWGGGNWGPLGSDPYGDVTLKSGTFAMQSLWSNSAGRCVMTTSPSLTVATPGTQKSNLGVRSSLQVHATTNTGLLAYSASGLPFGLSINKATGAITGTPGTTAGTFHVHVTVSEYAGSQTVSFSWQVSSRAGAVKGYRGRCADDYLGRTRSGNKIDIWSCDGQTRQKITFTARGELVVAGKCLTSGRGVVLESCTGSAAQTWVHRGNGEYVVKGRCLTDPRDSTRNGTQLAVSVCTDSAGQRWSLP